MSNTKRMWYVVIEVDLLDPLDGSVAHTRTSTHVIEAITLSSAIERAEIEFHNINKGLDSRRWRVIEAGRHNKPSAATPQVETRGYNPFEA